MDPLHGKAYEHKICSGFIWTPRLNNLLNMKGKQETINNQNSKTSCKSLRYSKI